MATITLPDVSGVLASLSGKKTYLTLVCGALVIVANHFDLVPVGYVNLDPNDWINELYQLAVGATFRSAVAGVKTPPGG